MAFGDRYCQWTERLGTARCRVQHFEKAPKSVNRERLASKTKGKKTYSKKPIIRQGSRVISGILGA